MVLVPSSYATSFGTNIVTNGDAETGDLTGWTATGNSAAFVNAEAFFGENVQTVHGKVLEFYDGSASIEATFSQVINISDIQSQVATGLVSLDFSIQAFSWYGANVSYTIEELDVSDNLLKMHTSGNISLLGQGVNYHTTDSSACTWTTTSVAAASLNNSTAKLRISVYGKTSNIFEDYVDFDNIQLILYTVPTVTTTSVTTYDKNSATLGGNVTADNGVTVTGRGVVYSSTDATPAIGESGVTQDVNASGTGSFSESIGSLSAGTIYYVRAYATNAVGTSYGSVVSFTTIAPPSISSVSLPGDGTYIIGQNLDYTVNFSEAVNVATTSGIPYLILTVGSSTVHVAYYMGTTTSTLTFRYTVVSGDLDANGVAVASNINLNSGSIKDAAGNDATVTFTGSTVASVLVDAVAPMITGVTGPSAGTYAQGDTLWFTATFDDNVTVNNSPYILVTVGSAKQAEYASGSGTTILKFRYVLQSGDTDADGISTGTSITLNSGSIKDAAGNAAVLTFTAPATTGVLVDAVAPVISGVTSPDAGTYEAGDTLCFKVAFDENVDVTGMPSIELTIGSSIKQAVYVSGSGSDTLRFGYEVVLGDTDDDGIEVAASIAVDEGSITDNAGNIAALSLGSLATSDIEVKTSPTVVRNNLRSMGYSLSYETLSGMFHVELPLNARHAEIVLLDAQGHRLATQSLGTLSQSVDVRLPLSAGWNIVVLRVNGGVLATWRGTITDR